MKTDAIKLLEEYHDFTIMWGRESPLNLTKPRVMTDAQGIDYGAESLYDHSKNKYTKRQEDYDENMEYITGSYTEQVIQEVRDYVRGYWLYNIGRVRFLALRPKECLTYHTDAESKTRFHIPIQTNKGAMFIVDGNVETMWDVGQIYQLDVQKPHTALNASREIRVHMVFDAY